MDDEKYSADKPHLVVTGGPSGGFTFHGPFPTEYEAMEWAANGGPAEDSWWVAPLHAPEGE